MLDWEAMYQEKNTGWDRGEVSPALAMWLEQEGLPATGNVLVPGCGRGHEVIAFAQAGYAVTGLDIAPTAIVGLCASLQANAVDAVVVCADLFAYQPEGKFDIVYEQTCMCAIEPSLRQTYVEKLAGWLKKGGTLCFAMMQTGEAGGPPFHCDWLEMRQLFTDEAWLWPEEPPFLIQRGQQRLSPRYELGFTLRRK